MDWFLQLTEHDWMLIGAVAGAFVLGFVFARLLSGKGRSKVVAEDRRDHRIRELDIVRAGSDALVSEFERVQQEADDSKDDQ